VTEGLPIHAAVPVGVLVVAGNEPRSAGAPDESSMWCEELAGAKGDPAADLDLSAHREADRTREGRAWGDGGAEVSCDWVRELAQLRHGEDIGLGMLRESRFESTQDRITGPSRRLSLRRVA
jgi:hypothetical protein